MNVCNEQSPLNILLSFCCKENCFKNITLN